MLKKLFMILAIGLWMSTAGAATILSDNAIRLEMQSLSDGTTYYQVFDNRRDRILGVLVPVREGMRFISLVPEKKQKKRGGKPQPPSLFTIPIPIDGTYTELVYETPTYILYAVYDMDGHFLGWLKFVKETGNVEMIY
jgi:hypothetical protein